MVESMSAKLIYFVKTAIWVYLFSLCDIGKLKWDFKILKSHFNLPISHFNLFLI